MREPKSGVPSRSCSHSAMIGRSASSTAAFQPIDIDPDAVDEMLKFAMEWRRADQAEPKCPLFDDEDQR